MSFQNYVIPNVLIKSGVVFGTNGHISATSSKKPEYVCTLGLSAWAGSWLLAIVQGDALNPRIKTFCSDNESS